MKSIILILVQIFYILECQENKIKIRGHSEASVEPELVNIEWRVSNVTDDPFQAITNVQVYYKTIANNLAQLTNIKSQDILNSSISIKNSTSMQWNPKTNGYYNLITGWEAYMTQSLQTLDIPIAFNILKVVLQKGASKIIKFKYDIQPSHKKDIYESLVKHAIYDAQYKVKEYTKQLHMKVVGIESIDIKEPNEEQNDFDEETGQITNSFHKLIQQDIDIVFEIEPDQGFQEYFS